MPTDEQLRDYLTRDPLGLGFDWSADDDTAVAAILNDPGRGGVVSLPSVDRARVAEAILADPKLIEKYVVLLPVLALAETASADTFGADMPDLFARPGSPAEAEWGPGTRIDPPQVSRCVPLTIREERDKRAERQAGERRASALAALVSEATERIRTGRITGVEWPGPYADSVRAVIRTDPNERTIARLALEELKRTGG